ncbi:hypothetical protein TNCV_2948971 [Trichonephila clavipes]|nr:hypothetical protein TNCV_2948971 [Trichonephila clavipes]
MLIRTIDSDGKNEMSNAALVSTPSEMRNILKSRGSRVVKVSDRGWHCHEFEPSTTKDPPCRDAMHIKSVEGSNVLALVCGRLGCPPPHSTVAQNGVANIPRVALESDVHELSLTSSPRIHSSLSFTPRWNSAVSLNVGEQIEVVSRSGEIKMRGSERNSLRNYSDLQRNCLNVVQFNDPSGESNRVALNKTKRPQGNVCELLNLSRLKNPHICAVRKFEKWYFVPVNRQLRRHGWLQSGVAVVVVRLLLGYVRKTKEQKRYAAFLSRRESIAGESPISFAEDTSIPYSGFEPLDYKPSVGRQSPALIMSMNSHGTFGALTLVVHNGFC